MSVAVRTITRLQDADDLNVSLGVGVDEYALTYDHDTGKFVLRAPFAGLLATGATTGATSQAQAFTNGIVGPSWRPSANSTTALQLQNASGTPILNVDTTNSRVGIGTTAPTTRMDVAATLTNTSGIVGGASVYTTTMSPSANGTASIRNVQYELVSGNGKEISDATNMLMYQYANSYMVNLIGVNVVSRYGAAANVAAERMLYLSQDSKAEGAVIGTKTGLYIDAITHGNTNYAIYTHAGKLRFGDIVNFAGTMGDSAKNPATDAPADWVQIEIGGVTHYLPAYAAA